MVQPDYFSGQVSDARRFYLDVHPDAEKPLAVVSAGCEHCEREYSIERKNFPYFSFEYVARGQGSLVLGGEAYKLEPGTLFSYGPRIAQTIHTDPEDRMVKYFVDFKGRQARQLLKEASIVPGSVIQISAPQDIAEAFDNLIREGLAESVFRARICASLLEYLILKVAEAAIPYGSSGTRSFYTYQKCRQFIDDNYLRLHTVNQIAAECFMDDAYLCRLFKRFGQRSPYQHLMRLKMNRAAELLHQPGMLVKQVADDLQFSDPYHFSRVFKRTLGISPEQFAMGRRVAAES